MDHKLIGEVAGMVAAAAYVLYIWAILAGDTKPSRVSWFVWAVLNIVICWSYSSGGATDTWWVALVHAVGCTITFLCSLKKGEGSLKDLYAFFFGRKHDWQTALDASCLLGAMLGLVLWWMFNSPAIALTMCIVADCFGLIPTIKKSWLKPKEEDLLAWTLSTIAAVINLFAVEDWSSVFIVSYPVYAAVGIGIVWLILVTRKIQKHQ